jgi:hypothetical protein
MEPQGQQRGNAISEEQWLTLSSEKKSLYKKLEGYSGCLKNCKLFFACRGALATRQTSKSDLLKSIDDTIGLFKKVSPGTANAQLLCTKPSDEGLVYPHLDRDLHMLTAAEMAEKITSDPYPEDFTKTQLIRLMQERALEFAAGMDHGHAHNFAVVSGAKDGHRMFVFDVQSVAELELDHKVKLLNETVKAWDPRMYGDTAQPGDNKYIKRVGGFRVVEWSKQPGSVVSGIEIVRAKLYPSIGEVQLFLLRDDPGCELLFKRLQRYSWVMDDAGRPTNIPDEADDDECDALRYLVMNEFAPKGKVVAPRETTSVAATQVPSQPTRQNYLTQFIQQAVGGTPFGGVAADDAPVIISDSKGRAGKLLWDF